MFNDAKIGFRLITRFPRMSEKCQHILIEPSSKPLLLGATTLAALSPAMNERSKIFLSTLLPTLHPTLGTQYGLNAELPLTVLFLESGKRDEVTHDSWLNKIRIRHPLRSILLISDFLKVYYQLT